MLPPKQQAIGSIPVQGALHQRKCADVRVFPLIVVSEYNAERARLWLPEVSALFYFPRVRAP